MYIVIGGDGREYGPKGEVEVVEWIVQGRLNAASRIKEVDSNEWQTLGTLPEFKAELESAAPIGSSIHAANQGTSTYQHTNEPIPSYLVQAILVTFFCCMPLGIPAIIFASRVDGLIRMGNYTEAREYSNKAKLWCWIGFGLGIPANIISIIGLFGSSFANGF